MNLGALISESRNPATMDLDKLSTLAMLTRINDEDRKVPEAIRLVIPNIAQAVDLAAKALQDGGRLIYRGGGDQWATWRFRCFRVSTDFWCPSWSSHWVNCGRPWRVTHRRRGR